MRREKFKMERTNLVEIGQVLRISEGKLPTSYYYTLGDAYAMSANYSSADRIRATEGTVVEIEETSKGYYVTVEVES